MKFNFYLIVFSFFYYKNLSIIIRVLFWEGCNSESSVEDEVYLFKLVFLLVNIVFDWLVGKILMLLVINKNK